MTQQSNAIMTREQLAVEDVKRLVNIVMQLSNEVFKSGIDFGAIPGTGDKPTLLQPGMEKLLRALHLRAEYVERSKVEDFDKGLFFYRYECRLIDWETGICVGTAIGSANSHEAKWRWRQQDRSCPNCGKETIKRSKFPPKNNPNAEPGWYCYGKIGGCGAEFASDDVKITSQPSGRVENPDIFDQMNTCDKIAQKRALGSAIKTVANVSMLYTVDLEDFAPYDTSNVVEGSYAVVKPHQTTNGHEPDSVRADQPSAKVSVQPRPTPPPASVAEPPAPSAASDDPLVTFGLENGASNVITQHPVAPDEDLDLYHCNRLKIHQTKTATQYILFVEKSATRITVTNLIVFEGLTINGVPIIELPPGDYPLEPMWSVHADNNGRSWDTHSIETEMAF